MMLEFAGLARKEDFPYITYYCPHCNALNRPKQADDRFSGATSPTITTSEATAKQNDDRLSGATSPTITTSKPKETPKQAADPLSGASHPTITTSEATVDNAELVPSEGGSASSSSSPVAAAETSES